MALAFTAAPEPDALLAAAQTNNFELRMRQVELEQQGFKVALAQKDALSVVHRRAVFLAGAAGDREQQVGIGISVPLPLWNRNEGNIETARRGRSRRRPRCTSRSGPSSGKSSRRR